ncbi:hypothetical protein RCL1_007891 [Eukaryota sp. TZLM3-RCL]
MPLVNGQYVWNYLGIANSEQGNEHVYLFNSDGLDSDHWLKVQVYSPFFAPNSSLVSVYASSLGLPSASNHEFKADLVSSDGIVYIEMLHADGSKGAVASSYLVSVVGHTRYSFYVLTLLSSVHILDNSPIVSSVLMNEKKYYNYRITDPLYERMVSLKATLTPSDRSSRDCLAGLSLFASTQYRHPGIYNSEFGGKLENSFEISEKDLKTGRVYFAVEGTADSCAFTLTITAAFNCYAETTCSSHGNCKPDGTCSCHDDSKNGFWTGVHCDKCNPLYTGASCSKPVCSSAILCNGKGACTESGECDCFSDSKNGFFTGSRCSICQDGYFKCRFS